MTPEVSSLAHGPAASRQAERRRRRLPAPGGRGDAHAHRRDRALRRRRRRRTTTCSSTSAAGCTSCRATARSSRCRRAASAASAGSTTRASTSSTTSATPRCRAPGDEERLLRLAGRIFSQRLDRTKPLWELWMVEGLEDGGWALISKTHHALVDGVGGVDLTTVLFDLEPDAPPQHDRRGLGAAARAQRRRARRRLADQRRAADARPCRCARRRSPRATTLGGLAEVAAREPQLGARHAAERRDLAAPPDRDRARRASTTSSSSRTHFGGTVNDVVLAVVAGALRDWLARPRPAHRGARDEGLRPGLDPRARRATARWATASRS